MQYLFKKCFKSDQVVRTDRKSRETWLSEKSELRGEVWEGYIGLFKNGGTLAFGDAYFKIL